MITNTITLLPYENATLTAICVSNTNELKMPPRRAVIVCPGGAYYGLADHEAEPVAWQFLAAGFATFVLRYGVKEGATDCAPLCQAALAVKHLREHATDYNIDPDHIFTCGFSAGGHLAGSAGVLWDLPEVRAVLGNAPEGIGRPNGMILCYPVISDDPSFGHRGSFRNLCGKQDPTPEETGKFSLEKHVNATTPPAFIWHTCADTGVPVENSLAMANAMVSAGVPVEMHIFPEGAHGWSLCSPLTGIDFPHNACWMELAVKWAGGLA